MPRLPYWKLPLTKREQQALDLFNRLGSHEAAANAMGINQSSVRRSVQNAEDKHLYKRKGLKPRPKPPNHATRGELAMGKLLIELGSRRAVAEHLGVSLRTVNITLDKVARKYHARKTKPL